MVEHVLSQEPNLSSSPRDRKEKKTNKMPVILDFGSRILHFPRLVAALVLNSMVQSTVIAETKWGKY